MKSWSLDEKIEANGIDDLKKPLLQNREDVTLGSVTPQINDIKSASRVGIVESKVRSVNGVNGIMVSSLDANAATKYVPYFITVSQPSEITSLVNHLVICITFTQKL